MSEPTKKLFGTLGRSQINNQRDILLNKYDVACVNDTGKQVRAAHGISIEADFRKWLEDFLPKKYGVTSGYIVPQGYSDENNLKHFDVIIYNQLEAPILWIEEHADRSNSGRVRAVPPEYVLCVLEIKSTLSAVHAESAIEKLGELSVHAEKIDNLDERYPRYLPRDFSCGAVFIEADKIDRKVLDLLLPDHHMRGYFGGIVLRGKNMSPNSSCELECGMMNGRFDGHYDAPQWLISRSKAWGPHEAVISAKWWPGGFSNFAFNLIRRLNGTMDGRVSSFYPLDIVLP